MKSKLILVIALITVFWLLVVYLIFNSSQESTPLNISKVYSKEFFLLAPQGWAFFTKPARERNLILNVIRDNKIEPLIPRNFSLEMGFGASRSNRLKLNEIQSSLTMVPDSLWLVSQENDLIKVNNKIDTTIVVKNYHENELIKDGIFLIKKETPTPWAWRNHEGELPLSHLYLRIRITE